MADHKTKVTPEWESDQRGRNPELKGQKLDVYLFIRDNPRCTRADVTKGLGLRSSAATARIKELLDAGLLIEPPFTTKGRSGVQSRVLLVNEDFQHKKPKDRVRVKVFLLVDEEGSYHAYAKVDGGAAYDVSKRPQVVMTKEITLAAPYPNEYRHLFIDDSGSEVSAADTLKNANLIVDSQ